MALVEVDGRYYSEGQTPEDINAQYELCEDLAHQATAYCKRKLAEGVVGSEQAALKRFFKGLQEKNWSTEQQNIWIVRRAAALLSWKLPEAIELTSPQE